MSALSSISSPRFRSSTMGNLLCTKRVDYPVCHARGGHYKVLSRVAGSCFDIIIMMGLMVSSKVGRGCFGCIPGTKNASRTLFPYSSPWSLSPTRTICLTICLVPFFTLISATMFMRSMNPRALAHLSRTAPAAVANAAVAAGMGSTITQTRRTRREYSSTRRVEMNYLPMVLESTPRGERAYDIYSRLLRVSFGLSICST